ncbi:MAG: DUF695 domain-containing protein [Limisphaerales bacterium]
MKSEQVIAAVKQDRWTGISGKHGDDSFMFRYREALCDVADYSGYSRALIITWTYNHDGCSGIPSQDEVNELEDFENRLVELFELDFQAVLAAALTERGTRQWLFYASDIPECQRRLDEMPQKAERYPIELVAETDADWSYFHDKIQTICSSAA